MSEKWVIRLMSTVSGTPSEHDGRFIKSYLPPTLTRRGWLDDGWIITTDDLAEAQRFNTPMEAHALWRAQKGTRPYDGRPNRPLTAWHAEIMMESEARRYHE